MIIQYLRESEYNNFEENEIHRVTTIFVLNTKKQTLNNRFNSQYRKKQKIYKSRGGFGNCNHYLLEALLMRTNNIISKTLLKLIIPPKTG